MKRSETELIAFANGQPLTGNGLASGRVGRKTERVNEVDKLASERDVLSVNQRAVAKIDPADFATGSKSRYAA